jgi:hypothetical protein
MQFMQLSGNPAMAPFIKFDYVLREIAASMDLDEDYIMNDPREAMVQAKLMAEMAALMPQAAQAPAQAPDPTNSGGGQAVPGNAPEPGAPGFTGGGGGDNGGNPPPQAPQGQPQ